MTELRIFCGCPKAPGCTATASHYVEGRNPYRAAVTCPAHLAATQQWAGPAAVTTTPLAGTHQPDPNALFDLDELGATP